MSRETIAATLRGRFLALDTIAMSKMTSSEAMSLISLALERLVILGAALDRYSPPKRTQRNYFFGDRDRLIMALQGVRICKNKILRLWEEKKGRMEAMEEGEQVMDHVEEIRANRERITRLKEVLHILEQLVILGDQWIALVLLKLGFGDGNREELDDKEERYIKVDDHDEGESW